MDPSIVEICGSVLTVFAAYKLLCYHRRNLFVCVSRITRPSGRNWVGLYEGGIRYGGHCCFQYVHVPYMYTVIFFHSLPSRVGCSFQGKLFSIFKLLCLVFVRYLFLPALPSRTVYSLLLHLDPWSWKNFFADTRFVLLTQATNLSRLS